MKRFIILSILVLGLCGVITGRPGMVYARSGNEVSPASSAAAVTESTNIHYTGKYCNECHEKRPEEGGPAYLKYDYDFGQLCKCHNYAEGIYIHPVDIRPSDAKKEKIPDSMPLRDGKVTCMTCHDIFMQCGENPEYKFTNEKFLRGAPFKKRTELCFRCHDENQYAMLNPHNQLDESGDIIEKTCRYCHDEKPDQLRATFAKVTFTGDLLVICQRCHMKSEKHPANANHLVLPSFRILNMMKDMEKQFGIILPLDYNGKIFCATCHNPHQRGVIPSARKGAMGASEESRQRLPGRICIACHEK